MKDEELKEELKKLRIQAKYQVIIMVSSLILVFLWFSYFSWISNQRTFSREAFYQLGKAAGMEVNYIIPITFFLASIFTVLYIIILKKFAPTIKENSLKKIENELK